MVVEYKEATEPRMAAKPPADAEAFPALSHSAAAAADQGFFTAARAGAAESLPQQWIVSTNFTHDLLVLYTPASLSILGTAENVRQTAEISVEMANKAYADSNVPLKLRIADVRLVSG
jgi:hypothetical protein